MPILGERLDSKYWKTTNYFQTVYVVLVLTKYYKLIVPFFPLPHPPPSSFLLSPHFLRFPNGKILLAARYFVRLAYGNACYAGNHLDYSVSFAIIFSPYLVDIISLFAAFINTKPSPCPLPREISICLTACFTL